MAGVKQAMAQLTLNCQPMQRTYDVAVAGGGTAGVMAACAAAREGARVIMPVSYTHLDVYKRQGKYNVGTLGRFGQQLGKRNFKIPQRSGKQCRRQPDRGFKMCIRDRPWGSPPCPP